MLPCRHDDCCLPVQGYLNKSIQKMHVSVCRPSCGCASSLPWAPRALYEVCISVKDSSHHLGLSPLTQNQSFHIPSIPISGRERQEGKEGLKGPQSIALPGYKGSNTELGSRNLVLNSGSAT